MLELKTVLSKMDGLNWTHAAAAAVGAAGAVMLSHATAAKPAVSLSTTPLSASAGAGAATATVTIEAADETVLGLTLGWLLVNRPALSRCSIEGEGEGSTVVLLPVGALQGPGSADAAAPPSVTDDPGNPAAAVWAEANPIDCVEVYHLHCHFNDRAGSEQTAKTLLEDAKAAMTARGVVSQGREGAWQRL